MNGKSGTYSKAPAAGSPKHTPGPWKIEPQRSEDGTEVRISSDLPPDAPGGWGQFASVVVRMLGDSYDEPDGIANAKLIAAAPTLADALEAFLSAAPDPMKLRAAADVALAALSAAGRLP